MKNDGEPTTRTIEPVKWVLSRRPRRADRTAFDAWVQDLLRIASRSPALEGSSVITTGPGETFILLRFASRLELDRFEASSEVVEHLRRGDELAFAVEPPARRTGLETWFTLPGHPTPVIAPARWKMALVTWCALLPQVIALSFVIPKEWPFLVGVALSTAIPVSMLTWFVMPRLTKWLYGWLYAEG